MNAPGGRRSVRRALLALAYFLAAGTLLAFLVLPVAAIFFRVSPGRLIAQLSNPVVTDALGEHILTHFLEAKRGEWAEYISRVQPWEVEKYLETY